MRFLAYGPIWAAAGATMAEPLMDMPPGVIRGGVLAILGWVIWYVFVKLIPAQAKAQQEQRDAFLKFLSNLEKNKKNN